MREEPPGPENTQQREGREDEFETWLRWLQELTEVGTGLSRLAAAEVRLATSDLKRFFVLSLLILPVALLAWCGFGVFLGWIAYELSGLPVMGFGTFLVLQLLALLLMRARLASYRRNMRLPVTRKQIKLIIEEAGFASQKADS